MSVGRAPARLWPLEHGAGAAALIRADTHSGWRSPITLRIGLATFGILALELAMIRWTSGQVSLVRASSRRLGLMHIAFPDVSITLLAGEVFSGSVVEGGAKLLALFGLFLGIVAVFVFAGGAVGSLFQKAPALRRCGARTDRR